MKIDVLAVSQKYRNLADAFLHESELPKVLSKYGGVEYEGSYAASLMMYGDIDIKIIRQKPFKMEEMFTILKDIHFETKKEFRAYYLKSDWNDPRLGDKYPFGLYIGLRAKIEEENWKFDLWFISEEESSRLQNSRELDIAKVSLTQEQREAILRFKQYRKENNLAVTGQQIYELVLAGNTDPTILEN